MKTSLLLKLFSLLFIPLLIIGEIPSYKVKSAAVTFKIKNAGITVDGSFSGLEAQINLPLVCGIL